MAAAKKNVINLGIGEPDFDMPVFLKRAAKSAIDRGAHKYTANAGTEELRQEISKKLKMENGIRADPKDEIIVTQGATQAIFVAMHCLLNAGDEVLLPCPLFVAYRQSIRIAGGVPIEIPMNEKVGYALDLNAIEKRISKRTKLLVLNSPCNPTGAVFMKKSIEQACELAATHDFNILSDEIYEHFVYDGAKTFSPASMAQFRDRVITINGFSKSYAMTGWRLGYAVANKDLIDAMTRYNMYNAVCPNSVAQDAGVRALKGKRSFFQAIIRRYSKTRNAALKYLDELGFYAAAPLGAFYLFPNISSVTRNSLEYAKRLLHEKNVATIPGSAFGTGGEQHLRISYSVSLEELHQAMNRISLFNKRYRE